MPRALVILPCLVALLAGCASTDLSGRHVTRLGPLADAAVRPASASPEPVVLDAGREVLDDEEHARLRGELTGYLQDATRRISDEHAAALPPRGVARVQRCTVSGAPTPRATIYLARCRVALELDGLAVIEVEATAERRTRARAVTEERAAEIRKLTRNPLLEYEDAKAALESALDEALRLLVTGAEPAVAQHDPMPLREGDVEAAANVDEEAMRADALRRISRDQGPALAAACVDLGRFGQPSDGAALAAHLDDESALVRRACATAIGELGAKEAYGALVERGADPDRAARDAIELAKSRLRALYPDLPDEPSTPSAPSKSSTEGAGD